MISPSKLAGLAATMGFARAMFVCGVALLAIHAVTFDQFIILALLGLVMGTVSADQRITKRLHRRHP